jgi:tRNA-uridine 2-sulfurtransferase
MNKTKKKKKVLVAISGGVDSALAAKILIDKGHDVSGIFLNFWRDDSRGGGENKCCSLEAQNDAKKVCLKLGVPFYTFNFANNFKKEVVDNFLYEYSSGRTPNPCVVCNKKIKIGGLIDYAKTLGFDYISTGHYCIVKKEGRLFKMFAGADRTKDQSYFLYTLNQDQLSRIIFPLGDMKKKNVRKIAKELNLPVASKSDSQEICFISGKRHNDFLKKHLKLKKGQIVQALTGEVLSSHEGLPLYTIGQRRGIEIGGTGPYYVSGFDYDKNILYVVNNFDDISLYKREMRVENINWICPKNNFKETKMEVVIRYQHRPVNCTVSYDRIKNVAKVIFSRKQRAVTPGQSAVFYRGKEVVGGGIIS